MKHVRWIWDFWGPHRAWLWVLLFLTLLSSAVTVGYPQVFRFLIDGLEGVLADANPAEAQSTTWRLVGIIAVIGLARSLTHLYPATRALVNCKIEMDVRQHYFSRIIDKGFRFFSKFRTGDLVTRLTDDIGGFPKIAWFSCSGIFRAVESGSKFIFCLAVMLMMNWKLALLTIAPLPIMLAIFYYVRTAITKASLERQAIISTTNDALESAFSGIRILKAFCGEDRQVRNFDTILQERIGVEMRLMKLWMGMMNIHLAIQLTGQIIVVVAGGLQVISGAITLGEFMTFYMYVSLIMQPLMDIPNLFVTSRTAFACIDREIEIEETPGGTEDAYGGSEPVEKIERVALEDVSFSYGDGLPPALDGISLTVEPGQRVAVVGPVGCGKTTLVKLVAGLLPGSGGRVTVNGKAIGTCDIGTYRGRLGYIPQEATLFSESVVGNVSFGRDLDNEAVLAALSLAQVREEMENLPDGLEQVLGQKGMSVSGGQKQRLAIARALAAGPDLLLMDDCTSALDAENERAFWDEFTARYPDSACLIVTHRMSTAREADVICVLDGGRIAGLGTHEELLDSCAEYRNLLTREELRHALGMKEPLKRTAPARD